MRKLFLALLLSLPSWAFAVNIPTSPMGYVHDAAGLLSSEQRTRLSTKLELFERETSNQIIVATFPSLEGESLEDFSIHLAEQWKIGQKGKDNGIILLIFPQDHLMRIEVGYGLESVVTDALTSRIISGILRPHFRNNDFFGGIDTALAALMRAAQGESVTVETKKEQTITFGNIFLFFFPFLVIVLLSRLSKRSRTWTSRGPYSGGFGGFGGFGGGSSESGFSGGGGGSFGGGGSSGNW